MAISVLALAGAAVLGQTPMRGPATLALRDQAGLQLVYRTVVSTSATPASGAPAPAAGEAAGSVAGKGTIAFTSTTFIRHARWSQGALESDVAAYLDGIEATGSLAGQTDLPEAQRSGAGAQRRDSLGRWLLVPSTTSFAPEIPLPVFASRPVQPGSKWTEAVSFDGGRQTVTTGFEALEERGGVLCARLEAYGLTFNGVPQSGPVVVWVDPSNGRTVRIEALFRSRSQAGSLSISYVRNLVRVEGQSAPQPRPGPTLVGPIGPRPGKGLPPIGG